MSSKKVGRALILGFTWVLSSLIFAICITYFGLFSKIYPSEFETAFVKHVIDGDTIELQDGRRVRYIGIDTPETVHPDKGVQCFGPEASERNKQLVEGKFIELLRGIENMDRYGRLLRYVFVDGIFVNAELITEGYARQMSYGRETRFQQVFVQLQEYSISKNQGLWSKCP